ncbi:MAG: hypothetical protein ACRDH5_03555, partial [bacterium]
MSLHWDAFAAFALVVMAVLWTMAGIVLLPSPGRTVNRLLALLLVLEGLVWGGGNVVAAVATEPRYVFGAVVTSIAGTPILVAAYLTFLGSALDTPLTRPLRGQRARTALFGAAVAAACSIVVWPRLFVRG